jgi:peptide/nickel transport system permease protein
VDSSLTVVSLLGVSIPAFWLGPMLLLGLSLALQHLPDARGALEPVRILWLPALTLAAALAARLTRMTRASVLDVLGQDYIRTARAKGLPERWVLLKHALRNAMLPVTTLLGLQFGALLGGSVIIEKIFARPGLGTLLLEAVETRNYRIVQGCVLVIALSYVLINLAVDVLYTRIDPRVEAP